MDVPCLAGAAEERRGTIRLEPRGAREGVLDQGMEQQGLGDAGGLGPMRGGAADLVLAGQRIIQVGEADCLADAQVAGHHDRPAQRAGQDPLG